MRKFTDDFFAFPIKIYDGFSLKKALREEEEEFNNGPVPIDWVSGYARIPGRELSKLMWHDGFSRDRTVEDVAKDGFDTTVVISDVYGEFVSTWSRKKFEEKLNEFMDKWNTSSLPNLVTVVYPPGSDLSVIDPLSYPSPEGTGKKPD